MEPNAGRPEARRLVLVTSLAPFSMATQWLAEKRERYCGTSKVSTSSKTESGLTYETYTLPEDFDKTSDGAKWRKYGEKLIDLGKRDKDGTRIFSYRCYFRCSEQGTRCPLRKTCQMLEGEIVETKYNGFFHVHTSPETGLRNVMIEVDGIVPVPSVSDDRESPEVAPVVHPGPAPVPTDRKEAGDADVKAEAKAEAPPTSPLPPSLSLMADVAPSPPPPRPPRDPRDEEARRVEAVSGAFASLGAYPKIERKPLMAAGGQQSNIWAAVAMGTLLRHSLRRRTSAGAEVVELEGSPLEDFVAGAAKVDVSRERAKAMSPASRRSTLASKGVPGLTGCARCRWSRNGW